MTDYVHQNLVGGVETKGSWVTDIKLQYLVTLFFKTFRLFQNRATDVITDVI